MLKKKAKVTNPNATLDFSACRDLNGRHMRYVNALVAIQKWKERQERFEELKAKDPNATMYVFASLFSWLVPMCQWRLRRREWSAGTAKFPAGRKA